MAGNVKPVPDGIHTVIPHLTVETGATPAIPVEEAFWGDRCGQVVDPFGHRWSMSTHVRDVPPEELAKAAEEAFRRP